MTIPSNYVFYTLQVCTYLHIGQAKIQQGDISNAIRITGASLRVFKALESIIASRDLASTSRANSLTHSLQESVKTNTGQTHGQLQYNAVF
jgi:hypothetical protein